MLKLTSTTGKMSIVLTPNPFIHRLSPKLEPSKNVCINNKKLHLIQCNKGRSVWRGNQRDGEFYFSFEESLVSESTKTGT